VDPSHPFIDASTFRAGMYTDDTQLSLAVAFALIEWPHVTGTKSREEILMDLIVKYHIQAFHETIAGMYDDNPLDHPHSFILYSFVVFGQDGDTLLEMQ
jgi:hypothetical protein